MAEESNSTPNSGVGGDAKDISALVSKTEKEASLVPEPEEVPASKNNEESSTPIMKKDNRVNETDNQVNETPTMEEERVDKKPTEGDAIELHPKLSFPEVPEIDFLPPGAPRHDFTPPRPDQPVVTQRIDSANPQSHYQITWNPPPPGQPKGSHQHPAGSYRAPYASPLPSPSPRDGVFYTASPYPVYYSPHYQPWYTHPPPPSDPRTQVPYNPYYNPYYAYPGAPHKYPPPPPFPGKQVAPEFPNLSKANKSKMTTPLDPPQTTAAISASVSDESGNTNGQAGDEAAPIQEKQPPSTTILVAPSEISHPGAAMNSVPQTKVYTKAAPSPLTRVAQQKERKNQMSRSRAKKRKQDIEEIKSKPPGERTAEEQDALDKFMGNRNRKNDRSRERAQEKKDEVERIMAKPLKHRTKIEIAFLEQYMQAKKRKNEGDRLRRQKLKLMGHSKGDPKPRVTARGPMPTHMVRPNSWNSSFDGTSTTYTLSPTYSSGAVYYPPSYPPYGSTGYSPYGPPSGFGESWEQGVSSSSFESNLPSLSPTRPLASPVALPDENVEDVPEAEEKDNEPSVEI